MIGSSGASFVTGAMISRAQDRVRVHDHPLLAGQPVLLEQDVVRHADLADVVEQAAPLEGLELGSLHPHHPPDVDRDLLDPLASGCAVNGSRLSTASARLWIVWVNISRISTNRVVRQPSRVQRQREEQRRPPCHAWYICAISHASGASATKLVAEIVWTSADRTSCERLARSQSERAWTRGCRLISEQNAAAPDRRARSRPPASLTIRTDSARASQAANDRGSTMPAWFASVPYHGIRPRSLAHLGRAESAATQPRLSARPGSSPR